MKAVDTSAIVAVARRELYWADYAVFLMEHDCLVGAGTLLEAHLVLSREEPWRGRDYIDLLRASGNIDVVPLDEAHLLAARDAFDRYGKGRHPAGLNLGDCLAYAVARVANAPLLDKGADFARTDLRPAFVVPGTTAAPLA